MPTPFSLLNYATPLVDASGRATREFYLFLSNFFNATSNAQNLGTAATKDVGTSGATVPLLNGTNEWSGGQTFDNGTMRLRGATSGTTVVEAAVSASGVITIPSSTDQLVGRNTTDTLLNKTLSSPTMTGTVAGDNTVPLSVLKQVNARSVLGNPTTTIGNVQSITAGQFPATQTNDDASVGNVGEFVSSTVTTGAAVTLSTATPFDITSISLSPGNWLVTGNAGYAIGGTGVNDILAWTNTASATLPVVASAGYSRLIIGSNFVTGTVLPVGINRLTLTVTTSVYLSALATFGSGSAAAYGYLEAWRPR